MYCKLSSEAFAKISEPFWFQEIAGHISAQIERDSPCDFDYSGLFKMPVEARAVFHAWWFACEAGGSGIEGFLLQSAGLHTREALEGLKLVGANILASRLQAAIPISIEWDPEYTTLDDWSWFRQFERDSAYPTIEAIDTEETYRLIGDDLTTKVNRFIWQNLSVFVHETA